MSQKSGIECLTYDSFLPPRGRAGPRRRPKGCRLRTPTPHVPHGHALLPGAPAQLLSLLPSGAKLCLSKHIGQLDSSNSARTERKHFQEEGLVNARSLVISLLLSSRLLTLLFLSSPSLLVFFLPLSSPLPFSFLFLFIPLSSFSLLFPSLPFSSLLFSIFSPLSPLSLLFSFSRFSLFSVSPFALLAWREGGVAAAWRGAEAAPGAPLQQPLPQLRLEKGEKKRRKEERKKERKRERRKRREERKEERKEKKGK